MTESHYLKARCERCKEHLEFPSDGLGLEITCPHCGQLTLLLEELPIRPTEPLTAAELQAAFNGCVPHTRLAWQYRLGLVLVALIMVLLPVAYFGFVAVFTYGVYWYALTPMLSSPAWPEDCSSSYSSWRSILGRFSAV